MELEKAETTQMKYKKSKTRPCTEEFAKFVSSLRIFSLNLSLFEFKIFTSNAFRTFRLGFYFHFYCKIWLKIIS